MDEEKITNIFNEISNKIKTNPPKNIKLNTNQQLKFYGLFKVATVGKLTDENRPKPGFFDFTTKYKNEAWEKCSVYSQLEAKIEYIKYYCEIYDEKIDLDLSNINKDSQSQFELIKFDFPDELTNNSLYSSNAKESKKEMDEYLKSAPINEIIFQDLKKDIYDGEMFTEEILSDFEKKNNINCKIFILIFSIEFKRSYGTNYSSCCCRCYEFFIG
ncbi:MAG: acyl-CoA-binding protein [archaeon]|nr:acyl-CoA-binding protein [archaeon]